MGLLLRARKISNKFQQGGSVSYYAPFRIQPRQEYNADLSGLLKTYGTTKTKPSTADTAAATKTFDYVKTALENDSAKFNEDLKKDIEQYNDLIALSGVKGLSTNPTLRALDDQIKRKHTIYSNKALKSEASYKNAETNIQNTQPQLSKQTAINGDDVWIYEVSTDGQKILKKQNIFEYAKKPKGQIINNAELLHARRFLPDLAASLDDNSESIGDQISDHLSGAKSSYTLEQEILKRFSQVGQIEKEISQETSKTTDVEGTKTTVSGGSSTKTTTNAAQLIGVVDDYYGRLTSKNSDAEAMKRYVIEKYNLVAFSDPELYKSIVKLELNNWANTFLKEGSKIDTKTLQSQVDDQLKTGKGSGSGGGGTDSNAYMSDLTIALSAPAEYKFNTEQNAFFVTGKDGATSLWTSGAKNENSGFDQTWYEQRAITRFAKDPTGDGAITLNIDPYKTNTLSNLKVYGVDNLRPNVVLNKTLAEVSAVKNEKQRAITNAVMNPNEAITLQGVRLGGLTVGTDNQKFIDAARVRDIKGIVVLPTITFDREKTVSFRLSKGKKVKEVPIAKERPLSAEEQIAFNVYKESLEVLNSKYPNSPVLLKKQANKVKAKFEDTIARLNNVPVGSFTFGNRNYFQSEVLLLADNVDGNEDNAEMFKYMGGSIITNSDELPKELRDLDDDYMEAVSIMMYTPVPNGILGQALTERVKFKDLDLFRDMENKGYSGMRNIPIEQMIEFWNYKK